jgi:hypothetical protein
MRVISFYTDDKERLLAERMRTSALRVGLNVHLYALTAEDTAGWANVDHLKPLWISRAMTEFKTDIMWAGPDIQFHDHPTEVFRMPGAPDMAACVEGKRFLHGSLMWFRNSAGARHILGVWNEENRNSPRESDAHNCWTAIMREKLWPRIHRLPPSYAWEGMASQRRFPGAKPVVSRDPTRRIVDGKEMSADLAALTRPKVEKADGTLEDATTKLNALLAILADRGIIA